MIFKHLTADWQNDERLTDDFNVAFKCNNSNVKLIYDYSIAAQSQVDRWV